MIQQKQLENETVFSCQQHLGQPICKIVLDQNLKTKQRLLCSLCIESIDKNLKTIEIQKALGILQQQQNKSTKQDKDFIQPYLTNLENIQNKIFQLQQYLNSQLEKIIQITAAWIKEVKTVNNNNEIHRLIKNLDNQINNENNQIERDPQLIISELHEISVQQCCELNVQLEQFSTFKDAQECRKIVGTIINYQKMSLQNQELGNQQEIDKAFNYEIIAQSSIKQPEYCHAIAINQKNTLVLVGCEKDIKVFELYQVKMKQIQILQGHTDSIFTLDFFKKQENSFISGSRDDSIRIWQYQNQQIHQWICKQILTGHKSSIFCLIYNQQEDLLISGSDDKTIKFWSLNQNIYESENSQQKLWYCSQTLTKHKNYVYSLSINQDQTKIISCGLDKFILVIEHLKTTNGQLWMVVQKIKIENDGYRLCFLDNHVFAFQPRSFSKMEIYEVLSTSLGQFVKNKEVNVNGFYQSCDHLFPPKFSALKALLIMKNGKNINIIKFKNYIDRKIVSETQFVQEQVIEFEDNCIYGTLSENGQYLISWDYFTKEIQIRIYQQQT
ncbi:unnamed protein product [Paramecium sonneborni]|uniref:WD domain, G-beta repeat protein n=1 Tax=Paramecium sonneborni TaxID=65129 RepID=A0A8S1QT44_9CILI|nr:unnamed protein product [Paramecium sonneborni]